MQRNSIFGYCNPRAVIIHKRQHNWITGAMNVLTGLHSYGMASCEHDKNSQLSNKMGCSFQVLDVATNFASTCVGSAVVLKTLHVRV